MFISVIDDHPVTTMGIQLMLEESLNTNIHLENIYSSAKDAISLLDDLKTNLLLVDLKLPDMDGFDLIRYIQSVRPDIKLCIYTSFYNKETILHAIKLKISGVISKAVKPDKFNECILKMITTDEFVVSGDTSPKKSIGSQKLNINRLISLTVREQEVLDLIIQGCKNKEIAKILSISFYTVGFHRKNLYRKFEVDNVADLIKKYQSVLM